LIGAVSAVAGFWLAHVLDASIAGSMAFMTGVMFVLAFLLTPGRGLVAGARRRARQKWDFAQTMLAIHLSQHEGSPEASFECSYPHLQEHFRWQPSFADRVVRRAEEQGLITTRGENLTLTPNGRKLVERSMMR